MLAGLLIGLIAGLLSGLFGIGGGILIVPLLGFMLKFPLSKSIGTSLASMLLPVGILAVLKYYKNGDVDFKVASMIGIGIFIMSFFGANFGISLGQNLVSRLFGLLLMAVGVKFLIFGK